MRLKSYNVGIDWEGVKITSGVLAVLVLLSVIGAAGYTFLGDPMPRYDEETEEYRDVETVPITNWDPIHWFGLPILGLWYGFVMVLLGLLIALGLMIAITPFALVIDIQKEGTEEEIKRE